MTPTMRLTVGAVALSTVLLAACSSHAAAPPIAHLAGSTAAASPNDLLHLAGECLREHGLPNVADPVVATDGPVKGQGILDKTALKADQQPVVFAALTACSAALAKANIYSGQHSSSISPQELQARLILARCIRAHGVPNFPDPNPTTGDVSPPPGLSKNSPSILAAIAACPSQARAAGLSPGES